MILPEIDCHPTIPAMIERARTRFGDREFLVTPDRRLTFEEADWASRRLAGRLLAAGVGKGSRVGYQFSYQVEWVITWLALSRIGAWAVPLSTFYQPPELAHTTRHADLELIIVGQTLLGNEQVPNLETAFPSLRAATNAWLSLPEAPYLRSVWFSGPVDAPWGIVASVVGGSRDDSPRARNYQELVGPAEEQVHPSDRALVIYTSGTSAEPKGVVHTHGGFCRHVFNLASVRQADPEDRTYCSAPFFWVGGVSRTLGIALATGSTVVCMDEFDPAKTLELMRSERVTHLVMWKELRQRLFGHIESLPEERRRTVVANVPMLSRADGPYRLGTSSHHDSLGMTETLGPHTDPGPERTRELPSYLRGAFGRPIPGIEHRIGLADVGDDGSGVGEIWVRGYSLMDGLYKRERHEVFDDDGWYHTGDKGYFRDGYLFFTGRLADTIKSSGANVAPEEVKRVLEEQEGVGSAIVVGLPDAERGQIVAAAVVGIPGERPDGAALVAACKTQLSTYKVPRALIVIDEADLPVLPSGKVHIRRVRDLIAERTGVQALG